MAIHRRRTKASRRASLAGLLLLATALLLLRTGTAGAQEQVGVVAAIEGSAQIGHQGAWAPAKLNSTVSVGDELRTGHPGRLRIVFRDQSVLNISDDSDLTIDTQVFNPNQGLFQSVTKLLSGKVRALVSQYYGKPGASYEINTATAVAGVRGTEFVVSYEPDRNLTKIVGISGRVEVHSLRDRLAHGVFITSGEATDVESGQYPSSPRELDRPELRQYLEGLEFIGTGRPESLTAQNPLITGQAVPEPDRAPAAGVTGSSASAEAQAEASHRRNAGSLVGQPLDVLQNMQGGAKVRF